MKSLTYRNKTLLLSSLLISPLTMAKPVPKVEKTVKDKAYHANPTLQLQRAEIKNLKSQIAEIQQQNQQKIDNLMARLSKLEKLTEQEEKKIAKQAKEREIEKAKKAKEEINKNKVEEVEIEPVKQEKNTTKKTNFTNHLTKKDKKEPKPTIKKTEKTKEKPVKKEEKSTKSKKEVEKTTAKKKEDKKIDKSKTQKKSKKKGKKVLGADEISVEQLDLKKLSAGAKIETIHKRIIEEKVQPEDMKIETIVKSDNDEIMPSSTKPRVLKVKKLNLNNKKEDASAQARKEAKIKASSELYLNALKAFSDKQTNVAIKKLKKYVNDYPDGKLLPKAKYWLGESYLQKEPADYANARYYFLEVVDKHEHHPQNNKQSKSLYRLCQLSKINNYNDELKKYADMLKKKYPNSKETKLALKLLEK